MQILLQQLYRAYFQARKNKRYTKEQLRFEADYESRLHRLCLAIVARRYEVSPCKAFVIDKPVYREIFAPQFTDRVVHHLIAGYILPPMERGLIPDAYSCRKGKGTSYGIDRVGYFMRSVTGNYARDAYILKLDISGYFMHMNRDVLLRQVNTMRLVEQATGTEDQKRDLRYLLDKVIYTDPTAHCTRQGNTSLWQYIPRSKSLFHAPENAGLPIGNLTSQLFGNIYLNAFDHWVKEELGIQYYGRYVDDMVFMHPDREFLKHSISAIGTRLRDYGLSVHPKKIYLQHYTKGVAFLGQYIKPYRSYIGNRTKNNLYRLVGEITEMYDGKTEKSIPLAELARTRARLNSYLGLCCKARSHHMITKIIGGLPPGFYRYFYIEKYRTSWVCKLKSHYKKQGYGTVF